MAYQESHTTSYGSRLSGSFKKIGTGLTLFIGATVLLFWNEGRAVKTAESIKEAQGTAVHVENVSEIKEELNGQLIHATAKAESHDTLRDERFGAAVPAIKLIRKVEYYQWEEHSKQETHEKFGGGEETVTTYTYKKDWVSDPINSSEFHDPAYQNSNFVITQLEDEKQLAEDVTFGAYNLPEFLKNSIGGEKDVTLAMDSVQKATLNHEIVESLRASGRVNTGQLSDFSGNESEYLSVNGNMAYIGKSAGNPQIGDVRVTFKYVPSAQVSLIAKVSGDTFEPYMSANGKDFSRLEMGSVSMENMFQGAHNDNNNMTWLIRLGGMLLVITALKMTFDILSMLFKWFPALGSIVNMGVGLICSVVGFAWSLLVISIAWLFYRPLIGISLIVVAGAAFWFLWKRSKDKAKAKTTANPVNRAPASAPAPNPAFGPAPVPGQAPTPGAARGQAPGTGPALGPLPFPSDTNPSKKDK